MATAESVLYIARAELGTKEEWSEIKGYEGQYEVSTFGRVRSLDRLVPGKVPGKYAVVCGRILAPIKNKAEYLRVNLCSEAGRKAKFIHRLVAEAFVSGREKGDEVNHKDENPGNNCASNLEWCTTKYNANYGTRNERVSASNLGKKKHFSEEGYRSMVSAKEKPVIGTNLESGYSVAFSSMVAASECGFTESGISHCITGRQKTHRGYTWRVA